MWLATDIIQTTPNSTAYIVAIITAAGMVTAAWLGRRNKTDRSEHQIRRHVDRPRRKVSLEARVGRLEHWKEQYADRRLRRISNLLDWSDEDDEDDDDE